MTHLTIALLGTPEIRFAGQVVAFPTRKALALLAVGRAPEAIEVARTALAISREIDNPWGIANTPAILAQGLLDMGYLEEALAHARQGVTIARANNLTRLLIQDLLALDDVYLALLDLDAARAVYAEAEALGEAAARLPFWKMRLSGQCAAEMLAGNRDHAYQIAYQAVQSHFASTPIYRGFNRWYQIAALVHGGALDLARADVEHLAKAVGANPRYQVCILRSCAALAAAEHDENAEMAYLEEASQIAQALNLLHELRAIEATRSAVHRAVHDDKQAAQCLANAQDAIHVLASHIHDKPLRTGFVVKAMSRL